MPSKFLITLRAIPSLLLEQGEDIPGLLQELEEDVLHLGPLLDLVPDLSPFHLFVVALVLAVPVAQVLIIPQPTAS